MRLRFSERRRARLARLARKVDYDSGGNLTIAQDALANLATMTYSGEGTLATIKDASNHTTSYQYDSPRSQIR